MRGSQLGAKGGNGDPRGAVWWVLVTAPCFVLIPSLVSHHRPVGKEWVLLRFCQPNSDKNGMLEGKKRSCQRQLAPSGDLNFKQGTGKCLRLVARGMGKTSKAG